MRRLKQLDATYVKALAQCMVHHRREKIGADLAESVWKAM